MIAPAHEFSGGVHTALQIMPASGAVEVMMEIVLARPEQFYRGTVHNFCDPCGFDEVIIHQAAAKTTADACEVHRDVALWNAYDLNYLCQAALWRLARHPDFEFAVFVLRRTVFWLELGVRDERV